MPFAFPLLSMFDSPALRTLSNAFLLSFRHAGTTLAVILVYASPWLLLAVNPSWFLRIMPLYLLFGFSLPGWAASYWFLNVFKKYAELDFPQREVQ